MREESVLNSELSSLPVLRSTQALGGWDEPTGVIFALPKSAQDPFADPVPVLEKPSSASRPSVSPSHTRGNLHSGIWVLDPFADTPVLVSASDGGVPSRLSKASSFHADARASTRYSNVRFSFHSCWI